MTKRQWTDTDRYVHATDPHDGDQPIVYWWEGMTAADTRGMVKAVYDRAYSAGAISAEHCEPKPVCDACESPRDVKQYAECDKCAQGVLGQAEELARVKGECVELTRQRDDWRQSTDDARASRDLWQRKCETAEAKVEIANAGVRDRREVIAENRKSAKAEGAAEGRAAEMVDFREWLQTQKSPHPPNYASDAAAEWVRVRSDHLPKPADSRHYAKGSICTPRECHCAPAPVEGSAEWAEAQMAKGLCVNSSYGPAYRRRHEELQFYARNTKRWTKSGYACAATVDTDGPWRVVADPDGPQ